MARKISTRVQCGRLPVEIKEAPLINWQDRHGKKVPVTKLGLPLKNLNTNPKTVDLNTAIQAVERGKATGIGLPIVGSGLCALDLL